MSSIVSDISDSDDDVTVASVNSRGSRGSVRSSTSNAKGCSTVCSLHLLALPVYSLDTLYTFAMNTWHTCR